MKFLLDQDVYTSTARFLREMGHDVIRAGEVGLSRAADDELLRTAQENGRILVTRDRDYGNLVFAGGMGGGVIYLRVLPSTQVVVHEELKRVLERHEEADLRSAFVVVEPGWHRIRRLREDGQT